VLGRRTRRADARPGHFVDTPRELSADHHGSALASRERVAEVAGFSGQRRADQPAISGQPGG
jgi:hypothetical protein